MKIAYERWTDGPRGDFGEVARQALAEVQRAIAAESVPDTVPAKS